MITLPELQGSSKQQQMTTTFSGYNRSEVLYDGQMFDTKNLGGDLYPVLSLRKKRGYTTFTGNDALTGINGRDQLTFIRGTKVYWNFNEVAGITVSAETNMIPKKIVNFGAYVCIWPDKVYFNTVKLSDCGSMERLFPESGTLSGSNVKLYLCRGDGTNYDMTAITVSASAPSSPANGKLWIDQSGDTDVLRQYTSATDEWTEAPTVYVKIEASNIGAGLQEYDVIDISGLEPTAAEASSHPRVVSQIAGLNGSMIVYGCGTNYVVVAGLLSYAQNALKNQAVRADLTIPDMDWVVESNNRLWGCKYGLAANGTDVVNEIRCSALGSFRVWKRFMGNSQDSYVASVGTDGAFTAAVTQKSYPVFFKENCIHQVYGTTPGSFQINTTICRGCQDGSGRSAVVVNERVYYKARRGVMMFDGSMPVSVSEELGDVLYSDARAGALGDKYYISMKDKNNVWHLFTYNTERKYWYKEDNFRALGFGRVDDELYAIDEEHNKLAAMTGTTGTVEDDFEWMADFGLQGVRYAAGVNGYAREDSAGSRYLSRFNIRMYMDAGAEAELSIMYDSDGEWHKMPKIRGNRMGTKLIPVIPRRCDHLRFRISGKGECRIYSIARVLEVGNDG